ncbi:MAG: hypothetical protein ACLP7Q_14780 [Isosphaeraceae bacterium]
MVVWQPKGFVPSDHLPQHLHRYADYARFYVGMIIHFTHRKNRAKHEDRRWARLSHRVASRYFPDTGTYKAIRDALIAAKVIEWDRVYEVGIQSMGYKLGTLYRESPIVETRITGKAAYHLRKKHGDRLNIRQRRLCEVGRYLLGWLCRVRVSRYAPKALHHVLVMHNSYQVQLRNLQGLADPRSTFLMPLKRDRFGRIHTPVAHGWKGFRGFLTIGRSHLVGLDIRNSQPLIFGLVLRQIAANEGKIPESLIQRETEQLTPYLDLIPAEPIQESPKNPGRTEPTKTQSKASSGQVTRRRRNKQGNQRLTIKPEHKPAIHP